MGPRIVLEPSWAISLEEMKTKVHGPLRVSARSTLVLGGGVHLGGLDLDGAVVCRGGEALWEPAEAVVNEGFLLEAIPEAELADQPPSLQIRGYRISMEEWEEPVF